MIIPLATVLLMFQAESKPAPMKCDIGPIERDFGGTHWIVYSCEDGKSVVAVSAANSPAAPFVFIIHPHGDHYLVSGEGNGDKVASDRAGDALRAMGDAGIRELVVETQKQKGAH